MGRIRNLIIEPIQTARTEFDTSLYFSSLGGADMSPLRSCGFYPAFERQAYQVTRNDGFRARFTEFSRNSNRYGMIDSLLDTLSNLQVGDFYRSKNEIRITEILQDDSPDTLTESLLCANPRTDQFFDILIRRIQAWYRTGDAERCVNDCRYFLAEVQAANYDIAEDVRIDLLLLFSDCCKVTNRLEDAKTHLNEAMTRISELAKNACKGFNANDEDLKVKKSKLFKEFLVRKQNLIESPLKSVSRQNILDIPEVYGKPNEMLRNCSYAVDLGNEKSKGRLLYANKDIKPGTVLIVDRPFSFITDLTALDRNCLYCHISFKLDGVISIPCETCQTVQFCSIECRYRAWNKFHKFECRTFDCFYENKFQLTNAHLAYRTVVIAAFPNDALEIDEDFLQLYEHDNDVHLLNNYESYDYKTVFNLETHCSNIDPQNNLKYTIQSIFLAKCLLYTLNHIRTNNRKRHLRVLAVAMLRSMQAINCNAYEIVENVRNDDTKILDPRNVGGAIYTSVSLINHSCYPNVVRHSFPCGTVVVKSIRFIPQGVEILDCYGQHFLENIRDSRRKLLEQKYFFECKCEACASNWPMTLPSDQFTFKCKKCSKRCRRTRNAAECTACGCKTEISKLYGLLQNSIKKRLTALTRMYDGNYEEALPLLLEHAECIDKILSEPSLEAVKTQQSIIQCLNAMSSTSV